MIGNDYKEEIVSFIEKRLLEILEWYVDCSDLPETRNNMVKDCSSVLVEAEKKFNLVKIKYYPTVSINEFGIVTVSFCKFNVQ